VHRKKFAKDTGSSWIWGRKAKIRRHWTPPGDPEIGRRGKGKNTRGARGAGKVVNFSSPGGKNGEEAPVPLKGGGGGKGEKKKSPSNGQGGKVRGINERCGKEKQAKVHNSLKKGGGK